MVRIAFVISIFLLGSIGRCRAQSDCSRDSDCGTGQACIQSVCGMNLNAPCSHSDECAGMLICSDDLTCQMETCSSTKNCTTAFDESSPKYDIVCVVASGNERGKCGYAVGTVCTSHSDCGSVYCDSGLCKLAPILAPEIAPGAEQNPVNSSSISTPAVVSSSGAVAHTVLSYWIVAFACLRLCFDFLSQ